MERGAGEEFERIFARKVDSLVTFLEKGRLPLYAIFAYVLITALIRDFSEYFLLDQEFIDTSHPWIFSIAHHVSFYAVVFLGLVLLLSAFSGRGVRRSANFITTFWWIIILPPFLDHFIGGLDHNYEYFSPTDFVDAILHFSGKGFHIGQATEVVVILFAIFAYAIWTQRQQLQTIRGRMASFLKVAFLVLFTLIAMFVMATPGAFLPVGSSGGVPVFPAFDLTKYHQFHLFLVAYYLLLGVALFYAILYLANKNRFGNILRSMRLPQTLFFGIIVAAGIVVSWRNSSDLTLIADILQRPLWVNLGFAVVSIVPAILAWQASAMWNDISDRHIDEPRERRTLVRGIMGVGTLLQLSMVLATVSILLAALLSIEQVFIILAIYGLAYAYSFRPIRFKERVLSPLLMGLGTFLAFLYGSLTPYSEVLFFSGDPSVPYLTGEVIKPLLTMEGLIIGAFCFAGLIIGSMVMDIEGYEEDKRGKVRTVYTALGLKDGKKLVAMLIFLASLLPLLLFQRPIDVIFPLLGVTASLLFLRTSSPRPVMALSFIGLVYAAIRYLGAL
jgi:4-hydroxybenzoate polyprenyltransferase